MDDPADYIFEIWDKDDKPKPDSKLWLGTIRAKYVGFNTTEEVTKYVVDVVAVDVEAAKQIVQGMYDNQIKDEYPILKSLGVVRERAYDHNSDGDKRPRIVDALPGMYGGYMRGHTKS